VGSPPLGTTPAARVVILPGHVVGQYHFRTVLLEF